MQPELLDRLAARQGHFKLESGHHGNLWLELDRLFLRPAFVLRFARELAGQLATYKLDGVCGPLVGGALIAQTIAAELDLEFYYTERFIRSEREALYPAAYRLPDSLRPLVAGKIIAIVDDVINAGSAVRGTLVELQANNAHPVVVSALLVLGSAAPDFFAGRNLPLVGLASLPGEVWVPAECPLCAAGMPLENLVP